MALQKISRAELGDPEKLLQQLTRTENIRTPDQKCWQHSCSDFFTRMLPTLLVRGYPGMTVMLRNIPCDFAPFPSQYISDNEIEISP